jgi:hypothetical protein
MMPPSLGRLEEHAFFILFTGFILVIFWFGSWALLEELVEHIHKVHKMEKWKIHILMILLVIVMIGFFPQILEKI